MSHRSSVDSAKKDVGHMIAAHCELSGFTVAQGDGYPGWAPNVHSALLKQSKEVHAKVFGKGPEVKAIHAGLECGIIGEKYPGLDVISFGPTIQNAHSPTEQVSVPSVAGFWKYLAAMLAAA
jgi:dipeptidase D